MAKVMTKRESLPFSSYYSLFSLYQFLNAEVVAAAGALAEEADSCISQPEVVTGVEALVAAVADSVDLEAEVLAAEEQEGIGDKQPGRRKEGRGTIKEFFIPCPWHSPQPNLLMQFRNFDSCKSFSEQSFPEIHLHFILPMDQEKF
jgi:hypothetical protein